MTFTTPTFIIFLVVIWSLYWLLPRKQQNLLILCSSLLFYACWDWRFLFLLLVTTGIDYCVALAIERKTDLSHRQWLLSISLATNLGILGFFKYFNFFAVSFHTWLAELGVRSDPVLVQVILPLGISFYTFQALSYVIDVYRGRLKAAHDIVQYFCFITFFPHLVAGPINFAKDLLGQFQRERHFSLAEATDGARQMLLGFFKKMVIADNLAVIVNASYGDVTHASGCQLLWATYAFAFQIYCDFSGYTDIAIGCAKLFNIHLMRNFAYPYFAQNIPDFWRRWHISLSTWFREYVYIPMGGNRVGRNRQIFNILTVFVMSGLWHGANWTFAIWGFLHGLYYLAYVWLAGCSKKRNPKAISISNRVLGTGATEPLPQSLWRHLGQIFLTFNLVCFAWIFFRAASASEALNIVTKIGADIAIGSWEKPSSRSIILVTLLLVVEYWQRNRTHAFHIAHWPRAQRWAFYYIVVLAILFWAKLDYTPFIYFQF